MEKERICLTNHIKKIVWFFGGITIAALGATIIVLSEVGSDSVSAACQALSHMTNTSIGIATIIFNLFFLIISVIIDYKTIRIGTLLHALFFGPIWDLLILPFEKMNLGSMNFWFRIIIVTVGAFILGVGLVLYQSAGLGRGASDNFNFLIRKKFNMSVSTQRILYDLFLLVFALIFGGDVSWGTLICAVFVGLSMGICEKQLKKVQKTCICMSDK